MATDYVADVKKFTTNVNEAAVAAFLAGTIAFGDIATVVARVLERYVPVDPASLADVLAIDSEARRVASALMESVVA